MRSSHSTKRAAHRRVAVVVTFTALAACTPFLESKDLTYQKDDGGVDARADAAPPMGATPAAYLKLQPPQIASQFGSAVAATEDAVAVTAPFEDVETLTEAGTVFVPSGGATYLYDRAHGFSGALQLVPPNTSTKDGFRPGDRKPDDVLPRADGWAALAIALSDDVLVIGVGGEDSAERDDPTDESAPDAGAVYVYSRRDLQAKPQYVKPQVPRAGAVFGWSVALSGRWLAVGAPSDPSGTLDPLDSSAEYAGAVYVYENVGGRFEYRNYVKAPHIQAGDLFGHVVALDGDRLLVTAPGEDGAGTGVDADLADDSVLASGAAFVFRHTGVEWKPEGYLKPSVALEKGYFGFSAAFSGNRVAVGAPNAGACSSGEAIQEMRGAVHVFVETDGSWAPEGCLAPHDQGNSDLFGWSVALLGDRLVVGAPWDATDAAGNPSAQPVFFAGAVYSFTRSTAGAWREDRFVKAPNATIGDVFGNAVALAPSFFAAGASQQSGASADLMAPNLDDAHFSGAAYVFDLPPLEPTSPLKDAGGDE